MSLAATAAGYKQQSQRIAKMKRTDKVQRVPVAETTNGKAKPSSALNALLKRSTATQKGVTDHEYSR